jgi:hypothetical protein
MGRSFSRGNASSFTERPFRVRITLILAIAALNLSACSDPVLPEAYRVNFPALPSHWADVLGPAEWQLSWLNPEGRVETRNLPANGAAEITLSSRSPAMILAWPLWPERDLPAGIMRPAGAIYPYDAGEGAVNLKWEAGPEAWLFLLMAAQTSSPASAEDKAIPAKNRAWNFNWPRFRELLASEDIPVEVREDPWLADWRTVAKKTLESGFDRRRIKAPAASPLSLTVPADGPWFGASPFSPVYQWQAGETPQFAAGSEAQTLVCPSGQIRCAAGVWMWVEWRR